MNKCFILLLVLCFNLFGYNYLIYDRNEIYIYYSDGNNILHYEYLNGEGNVTSSGNLQRTFIEINGNIKKNNISGYIRTNEFNEYLKNDIQFLNDFYLQQTQAILNYFYNSNQFSGNNHIVYDDYELLYNSDGLVVESIVNGDWAGLYDESDLNKSGLLYNADGELMYKNGVEVNWMEKLFDKFGFNKLVIDSLGLYGSVGLVVLIIVGFVIIIERFTDFSILSIIGRLGK